MKTLKHQIESQVTYKAISEYLPGDHSDTYSTQSYLEQFFKDFRGNAVVLDLGCGEGESVDLFRKLSGDATWHGVDIENSPEVNRRVRQGDSFSSFNGVDLPYEDANFDLIYCNQVLEHVRYPDRLIAEALRVLKPGGVFIGSVSYLEPYHSYSIFNFTPYGIARVFGDAGFELREIRPETDASGLINRQLLNASRALRFIWRWNYLYGIVRIASAVFSLPHRERNFLKIQFSGHLTFIAQRPIE